MSHASHLPLRHPPAPALHCDDHPDPFFTVDPHALSAALQAAPEASPSSSSLCSSTRKSKRPPPSAAAASTDPDRHDAYHQACDTRAEKVRRMEDQATLEQMAAAWQHAAEASQPASASGALPYYLFPEIEVLPASPPSSPIKNRSIQKHPAEKRRTPGGLGGTTISETLAGGGEQLQPQSNSSGGEAPDLPGKRRAEGGSKDPEQINIKRALGVSDQTTVSETLAGGGEPPYLAGKRARSTTPVENCDNTSSSTVATSSKLTHKPANPPTSQLAQQVEQEEHRSAAEEAKRRKHWTTDKECHQIK